MTDTLEQLRETAMKLADAALWSLSDTDLLTQLDLAHQAELAVTAVKLHLIREVESRGLPAADKAHSTGPWLGVRWRLKPVTGRRLVELAGALDRRPALDQALALGVVNTEHAVVISECVAGIPAEAGPDAADHAERLLIGWAPDFDAIGLRRLADRILYYVAPEIAERLEAKALAKLEAAAYEARAFTLSAPVDGRVRVRGSLAVEAAAIVEAALAPLCAPRTSTSVTAVGASDGLDLTGTARSGTATDPGDTLGTGVADSSDSEPGPVSGDSAGDKALADGRRPEQRRADALIDVCKLALRTGDLPVNGGEPPQLSVTVAFEALAEEITARTPDYLTTLITSGAFDDGITLPPPGGAPVTMPVGSAPVPRGGTTMPYGDAPVATLPHASAPVTTQQRRRLGIGTLDNGARLTPTTVRRIACDARILPAVLASTGQILDVGRTKRLFEAGIRRALVLRDRGCAFPTCTRPPRWCDGHHIQHWADGGNTSLNNAVLLCGQHHRLIHHSDWDVRLGTDGLPEFIPPVYLDLTRRPRRNIYHHRT